MRNAVASVQGNAGAASQHGAANARAAEPPARGEPELALAEEDDAPAARERPRITETGPMLPENVERTSGVTFDMAGGGSGGGGGAMGLEPAQISAGMNPLLPRLQRCAEATTDDDGRGPRGRIAVRLRIRPDGRPAAARVRGSGPPEFIACVRRVVASARFASFTGPEVVADWGFDVD